MTAKQILEDLKWTIRSRWVVVFLLVGTALISSIVGGLPVPFQQGSFLIGLMIALNLGSFFLLRRIGTDASSDQSPGSRSSSNARDWRSFASRNGRTHATATTSPQPKPDPERSEGGLILLRTLRYLQILIDALFYTAVVQLSGGPSSPYVTLYFLAIVGGAIVLSSTFVYMLAGFFSVLYGASLLLFEYGSGPRSSFFVSEVMGQNRHTLFASFVIVASLLFVAAFFSNHLSRLLRAQIGASERQAEELAAINTVTVAVGSSLALNDTLRAALDKVLEVMTLDAGGIYLLDQSENLLRLVVYDGFGDETVINHRVLPMGEGYAGLAAQTGETLYSNDTSRVPDTASDLVSRESLLSVAAMPLWTKDRVVGVLYVAGRKPRAFSTNDLLLLQSIAGQVGVAIENARLYNEVERLATTDGLTGLSNSRVFRERLDRELKLAQRLGLPLSLLILDVDHFKRFNDNHGHLTGDKVLCQVASLVRDAVRGSDIPARYGGEEFVVILPDTSPQGAAVLSERIRYAVEECNFRVAGSAIAQMLTVSVGVATFPIHANSPDDLIAAADTALYISKKRGRNRTTLFPSEDVQPAQTGLA